MDSQLEPWPAAADTQQMDYHSLQTFEVVAADIHILVEVVVADIHMAS